MDQHSQAHVVRSNPSQRIFFPNLDGQKFRAVNIVSDEYQEADRLLKRYATECTPEKFGITTDELKFFLQNLLSKGLLRDDGIGAIETGTNELMSITSLGSKFLDFIKS